MLSTFITLSSKIKNFFNFLKCILKFGLLDDLLETASKDERGTRKTLTRNSFFLRGCLHISCEIKVIPMSNYFEA